MEVAFLGVYDTVRALGIRWPILWRFAPMPHPYHSHALGPSTRVARHALALDETREAYAPVLWDVAPEARGQRRGGSRSGFGAPMAMWAGSSMATHPRVPLANIALVWMLAEAEATGLPLPPLWRTRYITDAEAPASGTRRGAGRLFIARRARKVGLDPSERLHPSARAAASARGVRMPDAAPA